MMDELHNIQQGSGRRYKAVLLHHGQVSIAARPFRDPKLGEVVLQVEAAGLCSTDLKILKKGHRLINSEDSTVLGHEIVGRVYAVGEDVDPVTVGERVVVVPNIGCGTCDLCHMGLENLCLDYRAFGIGLDGGFAEFVLVPRAAVSRGHLISIEEAVPTQLAVLAEPLSCCYRGLMESRLQAAQSLVVMGTGTMGLLTIAVGKALGATPIIAVGHGGRAGLATQFGADLTLDALEPGWQEKVLNATHGSGADVVVVAASSSKAQRDAIGLAAALGHVNFFSGLASDDALQDFPSNVLHYRQISVLGTTGSSRLDVQAVVRLIEAGRLDLASKVVTHVMGLRDFMAAATAMEQHEGLKCMLTLN